MLPVIREATFWTETGRSHPTGRHDGPRAVSRRIELLTETGEIVERRMARGVATADVGHEIGVPDAPVEPGRGA
ncbi:MAG: hypothetical protein OXF79_24715 [Chloroflexi bacterium]|nr:hypothetical protein [Chloroflexota bacterium]